MKRLRFSLTKPGDLDRLVDELNDLKQGYKDKAELFVERLADIGIPVIDRRIKASQGDSDKYHYTHLEVNYFDGYAEGHLIVEGKDILFIEFGAGIHYNGQAGGSPHPLGKEMGYTIGSYGKGQGKKDGWFYYEDTGEKQYSHGTESTMPMYGAWKEMKLALLSVAKEVFG